MSTDLITVERVESTISNSAANRCPLSSPMPLTHEAREVVAVVITQLGFTSDHLHILANEHVTPNGGQYRAGSVLSAMLKCLV